MGRKKFFIAPVISLAVFMLCSTKAYSNSAVIHNPANGHYYQAIDLNAPPYPGGGQYQLIWEQAKVYCESLGGYLATITSQQENDFILGNVLSSPNGYNYFLGGTDAASEGNWEWITGEPWSYTNWNNGEPNNYKEEDFLSIYALTDGKWNDLPAVYQQPFVCEWNAAPIPEPAGLFLLGSGLIGALGLGKHKRKAKKL